ncbi:MAG: hypothetical protein PWQ85_1105 [Geotoga sp.]|nr:hypothetical protein [Geotoga sp.]
MCEDKKEHLEIYKFLKDLESISEPIEEHNITERIINFAKEKFDQNIPDVLVWEQMAFDFTENYPNEQSGWGTYFGPMFVLPNEDGKMVEYPSIQKITPDVISYWEKRAKESTHPILKARYSNLVWDFFEKVTGEKPHYSITQIFIDSVIEIAEKNLHKYEINVITKLERALSLALIINDKERINKLIDTIICYERKIAENDKPGLWGFSYEYLVKNNKVSLAPDKEQTIITDLEKRFKQLLNGSNHWVTQRAALLLVDYYSKIGEKEKTKETLLKYGELVQRQAEKVSPLVASAWLEELYHLYLQYGIRDEADKISNKIIELKEQVKDELKEIEISIEIPKDELEKYINWLIDGDLKTVLKKIAVNYIPKKGEVIKQLKVLSKKAPLSFLLSRKIIDVEGRPVATVSSLENDIDGHIVLQISQNMEIIGFLFLRKTLEALISKFKLKAIDIVNYLYESPIFDGERRDFLIRGIESYLNEDFLISLHILIPQIEATIRNLAKKVGIPVLKSSRSRGFFYRTLDDLLRDQQIIKVLGEDMCLYFRILLTDPRGWNLRNDVCHGISSPERFNQISADWIFHAILCLALVREKKD